MVRHSLVMDGPGEFDKIPIYYHEDMNPEDRSDEKWTNGEIDGLVSHVCREVRK